MLKANLITYLTNIPPIPVATRHPDNGQMHYEHIPAFILGDSTYPNTAHTVSTFKTTKCGQDRIIRKLNQKLSSIRYCIEQAFGICKGRFRLLQRSLEYA